MIDLDRYECLQGALRAAFAAHADELCLIEANRDRENHRLTYREVAGRVRPLARFLEERGCRRAAILMSNRTQWHVSACAVFWIGAELVPLDPKLTAAEHAALLDHCGADTLIAEPHLLRALDFDGTVVDADAPPATDGEPTFVARAPEDTACIVYSSGTGGRPKGCILTHANYLAQCKALLERYTFRPGDRYLSILPTNHAIDFMVGFIGPYMCGATVVHLRTLRPEFVHAAFPRYRIAYVALVPMVLKNLEVGLVKKLADLAAPKRWLLRQLLDLNRFLTRHQPSLPLSRFLLRPIHRGFGGNLKAMFVGGAFTDPALLRFFYDLGIQVANGYGLTEAGTVVTLNDFEDYRPDTVGRPLTGTEVRIDEPNDEGIGQVVVRSPTVMRGYLGDPDLTAETIRGGWLHTGDLGKLLPSGHLVLYGRKKNMIVTAGGKNVYPEDIENVFEGLPVREFCVFAAHYVWSRPTEELVLVVRPEQADFVPELVDRNRRLPDFKRVAGYLVWDKDFPRTASLKIKRHELADQLRQADPAAVVAL